MSKCETCYYASKKQLKFELQNIPQMTVCNYCLIEGEERNEWADECTHYKEGEADYNVRIGCGLCTHYKREDDLFAGYCTLKNIDLHSYHPSCEEFKFMKQRICGTCSWSRPKDGGLYCLLNKKHVMVSELCPDHHFRKKDFKNKKSNKKNIFSIQG